MTYLYFILFPININFLLIQVMLSLPCSNDCRHTLIIATSPSISKVATGLFFGGLILSINTISCLIMLLVCIMCPNSNVVYLYIKDLKRVHSFSMCGCCVARWYYYSWQRILLHDDSIQ
ncbi:hypothetical protein Hanom_Chr14g01323601 [Helianthus anomalus]